MNTGKTNKTPQAPRTFWERYQELEDKVVVDLETQETQKAKFLREVGEATLSSPTTVQIWATQGQTPIPIKQKAISDLLGVPVEELFPPKKEEAKQ